MKSILFKIDTHNYLLKVLKLAGMEESMESVSLAKRFSMRPLGLVSKKYIGALRMFFNIALWIFLAADKPPDANVKLDIITKRDEIDPRTP